MATAALQPRRLPSRTADPDAPVIAAVLAGDPSAYAVLMRRHYEPLRRLVLGIVVDPHLTEDVLQDVFFIAYRKLERFRGDARLGTWLYRVAVREATRSRLRWNRLRRLFAPLDLDEPAEPAGDGSVAGGELETVLAALERLPRRQRAALVLHVVEGKSHAEIAGLLGVRPGTVGSWIHRARARLQDLTASGAPARASGLLPRGVPA